MFNFQSFSDCVFFLRFYRYFVHFYVIATVWGSWYFASLFTVWYSSSNNHVLWVADIMNCVTNGDSQRHIEDRGGVHLIYLKKRIQFKLYLIFMLVCKFLLHCCKRVTWDQVHPTPCGDSPPKLLKNPLCPRSAPKISRFATNLHPLSP